MSWPELFQTIALLCSIHANDTAEKTEALQKQCHAKLTQCVTDGVAKEANKSAGRIFADCVIKR